MGGQGGGNESETDVGGAGVGAFGLPRRRPVAAAVVGGAQEGAPLDDVLGHPGLPRIAAGGRIGQHRVVLAGEVIVAGPVPVRRPLPDIARHVPESIAIGGEAAHRSGAGEAIVSGVADGKLPLPGVGQAGAPGVAPAEGPIPQAAPGGELPLGLAGEGGAGPGRVGLRIRQRHLHHRMVEPVVDGTAGALGMAPVGPGHPLPPAELLQGLAGGGEPEHHRARASLGGGELRELLLGQGPLRLGAVAGGGHEGGEGAVGHLRAGDAVGLQPHRRLRRRLLRQAARRADAVVTAGDRRHRRRAGVRRRGGGGPQQHHPHPQSQDQ